MAKKVENSKEFLVIEASAAEMRAAVGSPGICDDCCRKSPKGYYVAVLNRWFCPECYREWLGRAKYYPQDTEIERKNYRYYKKMLRL